MSFLYRTRVTCKRLKEIISEIIMKVRKVASASHGVFFLVVDSRNCHSETGYSQISCLWSGSFIQCHLTPSSRQYSDVFSSATLNRNIWLTVQNTLSLHVTRCLRTQIQIWVSLGSTNVRHMRLCDRKTSSRPCLKMAASKHYTHESGGIRTLCMSKEGLKNHLGFLYSFFSNHHDE